MKESLGEFSSVGTQGTSRRDQILELRKAGLSYAEIGRRLGITSERARQICKGKPAAEKPALRSKVMVTASDAARLLGVHINTVRSWADTGMLRAHLLVPCAIGSCGARTFRVSCDCLGQIIKAKLMPRLPLFAFTGNVRLSGLCFASRSERR